MGAREEIGSAIGWQWVTFFSSLVSYIWSWVAGAGAHSWSTTAAVLQTGTCWLLVFGSAIHLGKQHKENWDGFGAQSWHADGPNLFTADGEAGAESSGRSSPVARSTLTRAASSKCRRWRTGRTMLHASYISAAASRRRPSSSCVSSERRQSQTAGAYISSMPRCLATSALGSSDSDRVKSRPGIWFGV